MSVLGLLLAASLLGAGPQEPKEPVSIRLELESAAVDFGRAFPLAVERRWPAGLVPEAWDDRQLAPLVLEPAGREERLADGVVVETLRFQAYAFQAGTLRWEELSLRARPPAGEAGEEHRAVAPLAELVVLSALGEGEPGLAEFPDGPLDEPGADGNRVFLLLLAPFAFWLLWWLQRRRGLGAAAETRAPAPGASVRSRAAQQALAAIEALRGRQPLDPPAFDADAVEIVGLLRRFLEQGLGLPAQPWTSEELLLLLRPRFAPEAAPMPALARCLAYCDREKFGSPAALLAAREEALAAAAAFVEGAA